MLNYTTSSVLGLAKREVATGVYLEQWGQAARHRNRVTARQPMLKKPHVGKSKRGAALIMK